MVFRLMAFLFVALVSVSAFAAAPRTMVMDVQNMTCAACAITIKAALGKLPGVASTKVDGKAGTVSVVFDPDRTTPQAIAKTVSDAGFPAKPKDNNG